MAEGRTAKGGSAGTGTLSRKDEEAGGNGHANGNAGTSRLKEELEDYIQARLSVMLQGVGHGLGTGARKLGDMSAGAVRTTASHAKDALVDKAKGVTDRAKDTVGEKAGEVTDKAGSVTEKAKEALSKGGHGKDPSGGSGKGHTIIEDIDVGVPVREAYDQWTQFEEFQRFAKGVVGVEQKDEVATQWHVKVAKSNRHWHATITEQVPDERIAWTSEGDKATTRGVVTFHPLGDNLTKVLLVLEYFPKGLFEKTGGLFRAQGRRARLDLKLYRTFVMMRGEATGGWRGEIRDGEVQEQEEDEDGNDAQDRYDEDDEDRYDDEEPRAEDEDEEGEWEDDDEAADDYEDEEPGGDEEADDEEDEDDEPVRSRRRSSEP
ncbi:putative cyclase/dehydratase [Streptomyces scabiei 87.22]|uniref:Putative cyclase/dehydratase n=1 Tax=Streptomyces scabiei (strain 87.22) TaxID=680198 RepID=C9YZ66_STRSW|nr:MULTISPECIES: SRPBCC family protein [Streptomyces]MBP5891717.1 SRPBCC family protein [Streptomyces sp. LBUM 1481]MBP5921876.1 SRPBCC family protein [Streptomyces sp. LBUM 1483]MDX2577375.1 SRPBCC family protein [Streptomyces scabiei]MDX2657140.1 SRPBCC family protein [Streptomyces scabiei]MDX2688409.1 SRPBCC family protein [Streptomyces scabiei]